MVLGQIRSAGRVAVAVAAVAMLLGASATRGVAQSGPYDGAQGAGEVLRLRVNHREAAEVADRVRTILGAERAASVFVSPKTNEIIVRAPEGQRALVAQIVAQLDRPAAGGRPAAPPVLRAYPVPQTRREAVQRWASAFRGAPTERAAWDERTGQLIVFASPAVQAEVDRLLKGQPAGTAEPVAKAASFRLMSLSPDELHGRLERLVSRPLPATWDATQRWLTFPVQLGEGQGVSLQIDAQQRTVVVNGDDAAAAAWGRVIAALDNAEATTDRSTELVTASRSRQPAIRRALAALTGNEPQAAGQGRLVAMQAPPEDEQAEVPLQPGALMQGPDVEGGAVEGEDDTALLGPVQVEFVEGLDIIVLRGNPRDVARVMQIINQIEQLSAVTVPEIEVLPLKHVASVPMAALLERVYQQVLGPRTGTVSITPLGKPNSLLLIGREENVKRAVELAQRLDQPSEPTARFEVFALRHAVATDAKELIDQYLSGEEESGDDTAAPALRPTATVVADFRSNTLIVNAAPRELQEIRAIIERIDVAQATAVDEVRIFQLRNALAADLAEVLRTAISQTGEESAGEGESGPRSASLRFVTIDAESRQRLQSGIVTSVRIAPDERANSLVVSAPADSMDLIAALIEQLDRSPDAEAELKVFTIANGDAQALVEMLRGLFQTEEDNQDNAGLGASASSLVKLTFSVDLRTNSIIAAGAAEDLDVVYAILTRLDGADERERINKVFRLNNAYAVNVAEILTQYLDALSEAEQEAEITVSSFEQIDREVVIVADEASNSLIISATPKLYNRLEPMILELDERPPMVMVQVLIAEVRLNDTDEFGIELGLQDSLLFDRSLVSDLQTITTTVQDQSAGGAVTNLTEQTIINSELTPGFNFNDTNNPLGNNASTAALAAASTIATQGLVNLGVGTANQALGFGGFVLSASSSSVDFLLRALQENRRLEVLSRPQITMLDGQAGRISVGQSVPRIESVTFNDFGQSNNLQDVDVGIILEVTPRISPEGQVVMQVSATRSEVGPEEEGTPVFIGEGGNVIRSPAIDQIVAETTVMAASGQTIVLSGLLAKTSFDVHRRVPILVDIPLIGDLFRFDSVSEERSELLIIMTPRVIRNQADAEMIKQVESARMSWVMCDVINMHGPSGLRSRCDEWGSGDCEAVYPTMVPGEGDVQPSPQLMQPQDWAPGALPAPPAGEAALPRSGVETAGYNVPGSGASPLPNRLPPVR